MSKQVNAELELVGKRMDTVSALCTGCFSFDVARSLLSSVSTRCVAAKLAQGSYWSVFCWCRWSRSWGRCVTISGSLSRT